MKKEYRGTRSVDAMKAFLLEQIRDPVTKVASLDELTKLTDPNNRIKSQVRIFTTVSAVDYSLVNVPLIVFKVIGYFESEDSDEFRNFQVSGDELVESCQFYAAVGDIAKPEMKQGANVLFKNKIKNRVDRPFYGNLADRDQFKKV